MGCQDVLTRKTGVIVGDDVLKLFNYAQEHNFAIPAIVSLPELTIVAARTSVCPNFFLLCTATATNKRNAC